MLSHGLLSVRMRLRDMRRSYLTMEGMMDVSLGQVENTMRGQQYK